MDTAARERPTKPFHRCTHLLYLTPRVIRLINCDNGCHRSPLFVLSDPAEYLDVVAQPNPRRQRPRCRRRPARQQRRGRRRHRQRPHADRAGGTARCGAALPGSCRRALRLCPRLAPSAVSSPALPPRRQAAQALAALLAQSGTDRAAVTQACQRRRGLLAWPEPGRDDLQQRRVVASGSAGQARRPARPLGPARLDAAGPHHGLAGIRPRLTRTSPTGRTTRSRTDAARTTSPMPATRPQRCRMTRLRRTRRPSPRCGRRSRTSTACRSISTTRYDRACRGGTTASGPDDGRQLIDRADPVLPGRVPVMSTAIR